MVHKFALAIGAVASLGIIAFAVAGSGFFSAAPAAAVDQPQTVQSADGSVGGTANGLSTQSQAGPVKTIVDKVYVAPTPKPRVVHVTAPNSQPQRPTQSTTAVAPPRGEHEDGQESENEPADHEGRDSGEHHDGGSAERGDD